MLQNTSKSLGSKKSMVYNNTLGVEVNHIWLMAFNEFQNDKKTHLTLFCAPKCSKISIFIGSFDCLYKSDIVMKILNE